MSNRSGAASYEKNEADLNAVCEFAEALRDAIVEYQVRTGLKARH